MLRKPAAALCAATLLALPVRSAATTCASVAACLLGNNAGSGVGVQGVSQHDVGVYGVSTANHGVDGRSRASYGVVGYTYANGGAESSARAGVYGIDAGSGSGNSGVSGVTALGFGVSGTASRSGIGVYGSSRGTGVVGQGAYGVEAEGDTAALTAFGSANAEYGGYFENDDTLGIGLAVLSKSPANPSVSIRNAANGLLLTGANATAQVVSIDSSGNEILAGSLTQNGTPQFRTKTTGPDVASYGARTSSPTLEDFGSARLRNGTAIVALDRTFASAIDERNYMVFLTPHGDSSGLYTVLSPNAFVVRENKAGRSNLLFDYRIVAKPLDANFARMPAMAAAKKFALPKLLPRTALLPQRR